MTDRELLEAAAKAAGMNEMLTWTPGATPWLRVNSDLSRPWNPLNDDGDALRLAVKLSMDIARFTSGVRVNTDGGEDCYEPIHSDPYAATRRAIVRAAAAMVQP